MRIGIGIRNVQVGSGGGFVPTQFSGCAIWLRADMGITLNGGDVSAWANQADTAVLASVAQAVGAKQPLHVAASIGGKPGIDFNGTTDYLKGSGTLRAQPRHVFAVVSAAAAGGVIWSNPLPNTNQMYLTTSAGDERFSAYAGTGLTSTGAADWIADTPMVVECEFNGASSEVLRDGTSVVAGNAGALGSDGLLLGVYLDEAQFFFDGVIAEYIEYSGIQSAANALQIRRYLGARYGIAVS